MKLHSSMTVNGREYSSGDEVPGKVIYPFVVPFTYFILYTFLLRHAVLDLLGVHDDDDEKRPRVEYGELSGDGAGGARRGDGAGWLERGAGAGGARRGDGAGWLERGPSSVRARGFHLTTAMRTERGAA